MPFLASSSNCRNASSKTVPFSGSLNSTIPPTRQHKFASASALDPPDSRGREPVYPGKCRGYRRGGAGHRIFRQRTDRTRASVAIFSATQAPVIGRTRSAVGLNDVAIKRICRSPSASRSITARNDRPISSCISWVRPLRAPLRDPCDHGSIAVASRIQGHPPRPEFRIRRNALLDGRVTQDVRIAEFRGHGPSA